MLECNKKNAKPAFQFFATMVGGMLMHRSARQHGLLLAGAAVFAGRSWASFRRNSTTKSYMVLS